MPLIDAEYFEAIDDGWRALHEASGSTPFSYPDWLRAWTETLGRDDEPVFLAIRREGGLIGVVPLTIDGTAARFAGDPNVFDYASCCVADGEDEAVAAALLEWLREDMTREFEAWGLAAGCALAGAFESTADGQGWDLVVEHEATAPQVSVADGFEAYVAALSKKDRHELRRKMRNFEAAGHAELAEATAGDGFAAALEVLLGLMRASHPGKVEFLASYEQFFRAAALRMADAGMARIATLSLDGRPAGATLSLERKGTAYLYNSGYDPQFAGLAAGLVSKAWTIRAAIERGIERFDFMRGEEDYKRRLGGVEREIVTVRLRQR